MLAWSYFRPRDDFLDKLLSGAGQSVLLGAILSFGFAVTGQLVEDERAARDDRRSIAAAIRADAGGKTFPEVDARDQNMAGSTSGASTSWAPTSPAQTSLTRT